MWDARPFASHNRRFPGSRPGARQGRICRGIGASRPPSARRPALVRPGGKERHDQEEQTAGRHRTRRRWRGRGHCVDAGADGVGVRRRRSTSPTSHRSPTRMSGRTQWDRRRAEEYPNVKLTKVDTGFDATKQYNSVQDAITRKSSGLHRPAARQRRTRPRRPAGDQGGHQGRQRRHARPASGHGGATGQRSDGAVFDPGRSVASGAASS